MPNGNSTWPPDKSNTANFPSDIAFNPFFHHLSLCLGVRSSTVDTLLSGTGSIAAVGSPESQIKHHDHHTICALQNKHIINHSARTDRAIQMHLIIRSILWRSMPWNDNVFVFNNRSHWKTHKRLNQIAIAEIYHYSC